MNTEIKAIISDMDDTLLNDERASCPTTPSPRCASASAGASTSFPPAAAPRPA